MQHARRIAFFAFMTGVFLAVCTGITAYLLRTPFILAFTDDEEVVAGAHQIWAIVSLVMMPCDAVFAIAGNNDLNDLPLHLFLHSSSLTTISHISSSQAGCCAASV